MMQHFDKVKPIIEKRIKKQLDAEGIPYTFNLQDKSFSIDPFFKGKEKDLERVVKEVNSKVIDEFIAAKGDYKKIK